MRLLRLLLRVAITGLATSLAVFVLSGAFLYAWQNAHDKTPAVPWPTLSRLERLYWELRVKYLYPGDAVERVVDPEDSSEVTFLVRRGDPAITTAYRLAQQGLITDPELFIDLVKAEGVQENIQYGVYSLRRNMTMPEIMRALQHGRLPSVTVTIPEGWRVEQIAALLEERDVTSAYWFIEAVKLGRTDLPFLADRPAGAPSSVEGFLFPDTYELPEQFPAERVLDIMLRNWSAHIPESAWKKAADHGLTVYEAVTLASIVEREAVIARERPVIAGVFLNRLGQMSRPGSETRGYLQSDPTVQYAKGFDPARKSWWNPTTPEDWTGVVSPYNTYINPGLPPGPICNPGESAIMGVLEPATHGYLYFIAKGDGSHAFAATYAEHLINQALYSGR